MKKVLVIGASGSLAKYVIDALQNVADIHLTLLARNRNSIANDTSKATIVEADVMDYGKLEKSHRRTGYCVCKPCRRFGSNVEKYCKSHAGNEREKSNRHQFHRYLCNACETGFSPLQKNGRCDRSIRTGLYYSSPRLVYQRQRSGLCHYPKRHARNRFSQFQEKVLRLLLPALFKILHCIRMKTWALANQIEQHIIAV